MRMPICLFLLHLCLPAWAEPVVVFAAASLKEPMDTLAQTQGDVVVSYGGSGALARQVLQGAPADVVVLAHPIWMQALNDGGLLVPHTQAIVARNALVLVGPQGSADLELTPQAVTERLGTGRLAIGLTNAVPAGQYGKAALIDLGLWDSVQPRLAEVDNVRAALMLAARGEVPLAVVYATDAQASDAVTVVARFPASSHPTIAYPAALIRDTPAARGFLDQLFSVDGRATFAAYGFAP